MNFFGRTLIQHQSVLLSRKTNSINLLRIDNSKFLPTTTGDLVNRSLHMSINNRWLRLTTVAGSAAAISGSYYGFKKYRDLQPMSTAVHIKGKNMEVTKIPEIIPTKRVTGPTKLDFDLTLYQYCSCPFCCKTRTFLDFFGLNYNIVEVDPVFRKKLQWTSYKKVPILLAHSPHQSGNAKLESEDSEGKKCYQINDSSVIISSIGSLLLSKRSLNGKGKQTQMEKNMDELQKILVNYQSEEIEEDGKKLEEVPNKYFLMLGDIASRELSKRESSLAEERQWRDWADRVLVHTLSPNIYRTLPESIQTFKNFSLMGDWENNFSTMERMAAVYLGSSVMWIVAKRLKKKYNLKADARESLYDNCRLWTKAIGKDRKFMGGDHPNLADISVYGVLKSIEGCEAFKDMVENTNIEPWYKAVEASCQNNDGAKLIHSI